MKKILFSLALVAGISMVNAQNVIWSDNFDDEDISDWTLYDEDGDTYEWETVALTDFTPAIASYSYDNATFSVLTPDNWIVSPAINLTEATNSVLKFLVKTQDPLWADETYSVYAATSNTVAAFLASEPLLTENAADNGTGGEFYEKELDLSAFDGEAEVYIAFRHHDSSDMFALHIDDVSVTAGEESSDEYCTPSILECGDGDIIMNVTFAGIDNDSACSPDGYGDYTDLAPAMVLAGETYDLSMTIGNGWYEKVSLWIDFDNSMTFDEDERFEVVEGDTGGELTTQITIPADAVEGVYRMRFVLLAAGSGNPYPQDPCDFGTSLYGETEDYMIEVGVLGVSEINSSITALYPNPVVDTFNVNLSSKFTSNVTVTVTDLAGRTVKTFGAADSYNVSDLSKGVYVVTITDGKNTETKKIVKK